MSASTLTHLFNEEVYTIPAMVTILVNKPWSEISEDHKTLLAKILGSVKLGLASARVIYREGANLDDLKTLGCQRILIFGSEAPINSYEHIQAQGFSVIRADELAALDDAKKKSLWLALKNMFTA